MALEINANRVALGAGILAAAAYLVFSRRTEADSIDEWIRETNPGLTNEEYDSIRAWFDVQASIRAAIALEESLHLPELATTAAASDTAAAEAEAEYIADPTAENKAEADRLEAQRVLDLQIWVDSLSQALAGYEASAQEAEDELSPTEDRYNAAFAIWAEKRDYIDWRLASTDAQAFVFSETNYKGDMWGVPWGDFARCTELGIRNDSIESLKVLKGAKLFLYTAIDFLGPSPDVNGVGGTTPFDAEKGNIYVPDLEKAEFKFFSNQMSSLKCLPSMAVYIADMVAAQSNMNTHFTAMATIQAELNNLKFKILESENYLALLNFFNVRVNNVLLRIDALIARLVQYGV